MIISGKLSNDETQKLITVLERHRSVIGHSLQDLIGISPTLCTHRIPINPDSSPSMELQRRLNNAMREVVKKEVLKLLHARIIYLVPYSEWVSPVQVVPKKEGMVHEAFQHFVNERQWEVILLSGLVKFLVVNAHLPPGDNSLRNDFILLIPNNHHSSFLWPNLDRANPLTMRHVINNPGV